MNETATAEYLAEVERATKTLSNAVKKIRDNRDNNANQARAVDLSDGENMHKLAVLWETSHAFNQAQELTQPALDILDQLDAFRAGSMHHEPEEHPMAKRAQHLEMLLAKAADEAELAYDTTEGILAYFVQSVKAREKLFKMIEDVGSIAGPKYRTPESILAYLVQQAQARRRLSNAIKGAAIDMGYGEVKSVEAFIRESHEKLVATRERANKERAALEKIAGMLGLEVKPGAPADAFVEAARRRVHALENSLPPKRDKEPFQRGEIIAGLWEGAPTDLDCVYVGKFVGCKEGSLVRIERPFHQDYTEVSYWLLVNTDLKADSVRLATEEEVAKYGKAMTEGNLW